MGRKSKVYPCKLGTIPEFVNLRYNYKLEVGKIVKFKREREGQNQWKDGIIEDVHPSGYFRLSHV